MKRVIRASLYGQSYVEREGQQVLIAMQGLLATLNDAPPGFVDNNELGPLHHELEEIVPEFSGLLTNHLLTCASEDIRYIEPDVVDIEAGCACLANSDSDVGEILLDMEVLLNKLNRINRIKRGFIRDNDLADLYTELSTSIDNLKSNVAASTEA